MTKYVKSAEALPSQLHLWDPIPTQTAIIATKTVDINPLTTIENSDTIPFIIPAFPKAMLAKVQIVTDLKVTTNTGTNLADNTNVSTAPHLAAALWKNVTVEIGNQQLTQSFDNCYSMFKFFDTILHVSAGSAKALEKHEGIILDSTDNKADSENCTFYPADEAEPVNKNAKLRADRIKGSASVNLISDFNASIFKTGKLLPSNLEIKIKLTKNDNNFILLAPTTDTSKIVLEKVALRCTWQIPTDGILNSLEKRLSNENAIFHADKNFLSFRPIPAGVTEYTFDNLFNGTLPYVFMIGIQDRSALGRNRNKNPFSLHSFKRVQLYIDGQQHFPIEIESSANDNSSIYSTFLTESGNINGGDTLVAKNYSTYPIFVFDLTQDKTQNQHGLNLQRSGTVRLTLGFDNETPADYVLMVMAYFDRVIEITKDREVIFI